MAQGGRQMMTHLECTAYEPWCRAKNTPTHVARVVPISQAAEIDCPACLAAIAKMEAASK
jgi:hypothetical protein